MHSVSLGIHVGLKIKGEKTWQTLTLRPAKNKAFEKNSSRHLENPKVS